MYCQNCHEVTDLGTVLACPTCKAALCPKCYAAHKKRGHPGRIVKYKADDGLKISRRVRL